MRDEQSPINFKIRTNQVRAEQTKSPPQTPMKQGPLSCSSIYIIILLLLLHILLHYLSHPTSLYRLKFINKLHPLDTQRPYASLHRQPAKGRSMADYQSRIVFDSTVDVSEETDLAFQYFEHFTEDEGHDLHRLMQGMLVAISYLAKDQGHPVQ